MFRWYVVNTYSGHEKKVQTNLEHRRKSMNQEHTIRRIVVPTEMQVETKDGQKVQVEKRVLPGYVLVQMDADAETVSLVRNTPGVTGFVGMSGGGGGATHMPVPLSQAEVDSILHTAAAAGAEAKPKAARRVHARPARQDHVRARCPISTVRSSRSTTRPASSRCTSASSSARSPSS